MTESAALARAPAPGADDDRVHHADWLEIKAVTSDDHNSSIEDLIRQLRRTGSGQSQLEDRGSENSQRVAEDAFSEIEDRWKACGGAAGGYPFDVGNGYIQLRARFLDAPYTFLLLLSHIGPNKRAANIHPERLFEDLCAEASARYLGGESLGARSCHFGFPRRVLPKDFPNALSAVCKHLGEGEPNARRPTVNDQKDGKLDIVAWKDFHDRRRGKLIFFGQCAAGRTDWQNKRSELQPRDFMKAWLLEQTLVDPTKLFFVPWRVEDDHWDLTCVSAGILFERCRIASLLTPLTLPLPAPLSTRRRLRDLQVQITRWTEAVLKSRSKSRR